MKTKAIIFDKDGTLLDFAAFWLAVSERALDDLREVLQCLHVPREELLTALGIKGRVVDIEGVLCKGTYAQMGQKIYQVLRGYGYEGTLSQVIEVLLEVYHRNIEAGQIRPACNHLLETLERLREFGIKLAVVTTDEPDVTQKCLQTLGIASCFDAVYTDDGKLPLKPDPYCIHEFCIKNRLSKSQVAMVGDTTTDIRFARNGDIRAIGVIGNNANRSILADEADAVIPDVSHIFEVLE